MWSSWWSRSPAPAASRRGLSSKETSGSSAPSSRTGARCRSGATCRGCSKGRKPAIAITEPEAGSAATDLTTRAEETAGGYTLHGSKRWITGAGTSRLYLVFCRMSAAPGAEGIGGVLVERDTPGFRIGERDHTMGLRGIPEGRLHFADCHVPADNVLVCPPDGFKQLMRAYNGQRLGAATRGARTGAGRLRARARLRGRSAGSSDVRLATSRAFAGSSPTWPSRSTRRAC